MVGWGEWNDWWIGYFESDFVWEVVNNIKWGEREEIVFKVDCCEGNEI